ncbi:hypothetical protein SZ64_00685 [Erythrobacter sp. SG61-1L]|nr:hypothetical protein SZ64_00685 [Erythrobacter sp. SG61-1L]
MPDNCVAGAVLNSDRAFRSRKRFKILKGMELDVIQTGYSATDRTRAPAMASWQWRVPAAQDCGDNVAAIPLWARGDLVTVRHLFSTAELHTPAETDPPTPLAPQFYSEALIAASDCGAGKSKCLVDRFLEKFADGLELDVRDMENDSGSTEPEQARSDWVSEPITPAGGLALWFANLFPARDADFDLLGIRDRPGNPPIDCAKADQTIDNERPPAECNFAQAALIWKGDVGDLPGEFLQGYTRLDLLRTGDPLAAMRPPRTDIPLDPAIGEIAPCANDGIGCRLERQMVAGFNDIDIRIPVLVRSVSYPGSERLVMVPAWMSIEAFSREYGTIRRIERPLDWIPTTVSLVNGKSIASSKLADSDGRVTLFIDQGGLGKGLRLKDVRLSDILLAPGDLIVIDPF